MSRSFMCIRHPRDDRLVPFTRRGYKSPAGLSTTLFSLKSNIASQNRHVFRADSARTLLRLRSFIRVLERERNNEMHALLCISLRRALSLSHPRAITHPELHEEFTDRCVCATLVAVRHDVYRKTHGFASFLYM